MNIKRLSAPEISYEIPQFTPHVAFECPECRSEVNLDEIIEQNGTVKCMKCV